MARAKKKAQGKYETIKTYYRIVCGKKQTVTAHNRKRKTKKKSRLL